MMQIRPFLRWAGSKRKLIPNLKRFWSNAYCRYVEPFAGSACLFFDLQPAEAVLSDKNEELIEMYEVVRENPTTVYDNVTALPRDARTYYKQRTLNPASLSALRRASRFIYLNRNCFNGIFRTNQSGLFNVPFSASRTGRFVSRGEFLAAARLLKRAKLRACDFGKTISSARNGDFVYIDPPYAVGARRVFRQYDSSPFGPPDLDRLTRHLKSLDERGATFLVSYADSKEARMLARPWHHMRLRIRRQIAGFLNARRNHFELLITNQELESKQNGRQ
jgi:DNA adenine methylase